MDYYVDPTGTDDGSHGTAPGAGAWKTLTYALGSSGVPLTGGPHALVVADGTYSEGATLGLVVDRLFGGLVTVVGNVDTPSSVIIQPGTANAQTALTLVTTTNLLFRGVTFRPNGTGTGATFMVRHNGVCSNIAFEDCHFLATAATQYLYTTNGKLITGLRWTRCTLDSSASSAMSILVAGSSGIVPTGLVVEHCTVIGASVCLYFNEGAQVVIRDTDVYASGTVGVLIGKDGIAQVNTAACYLERVNVVCSGDSTHGILIGTGSVESAVKNCTIFSAGSPNGYGFVLKGIRDVIDGCLVIAGGRNGVYFKGSKDVEVRNSTIVQQLSGVECFASAVGLVRAENPDGKSSGSVVRDCIGVAAPGSVVFDWDTATHDATDDIKLLAYSGALGTNLPSNGYGSPLESIAPAVPIKHGWKIDA